MRWIPFVSFWQVTADLPFATEVPGGHGHKYTSEYVDAWATVIQPPDWTEAKAAASARSSPASTELRPAPLVRRPGTGRGTTPATGAGPVGRTMGR